MSNLVFLWCWRSYQMVSLFNAKYKKWVYKNRLQRFFWCSGRTLKIPDLNHLLKSTLKIVMKCMQCSHLLFCLYGNGNRSNAAHSSWLTLFSCQLWNISAINTMSKSWKLSKVRNRKMTWVVVELMKMTLLPYHSSLSVRYGIIHVIGIASDW